MLRNDIFRCIKRKVGTYVKILSIILILSLFSQTTIMYSYCIEPKDDIFDSKSREEKIDDTNCISNYIDNDQSFNNATVADCTDTLMQIDLCEGNNLDETLLCVINVIEKANENTDVYEHFKDIFNNEKLMKDIESLKNALSVITPDKTVKQVEIISELKILEKTMETIDLKSHHFYGFIDAMKNVYKAIVSRKIADDVIENNRQSVESKMQNGSAYSSVGVGVNSDIEGIQIGISVDINKSAGTSEKDFYKTTSDIGVKFSLGIGLGKFVSLKSETKMDIVKTLVYRSIEQFLDTNYKNDKITIICFRAPEINEIIDTRKEMQKSEKKALASMSVSIESYLKALQIIPQTTKLILPDITKTQSATREYTSQLTQSLSGTVKILSDAGLNLSSSVGLVGGVTVTSVSHAYISLIDEDCLPTELGGNASNIINFLKQKDTRKFKQVKALLSYDANVMNMILNAINGDLRSYNWCLSIMSDMNTLKHDKNKARKLKKAIEKDWLKSHDLKTANKGRLDMLKAAISIASILKDYQKNLYNEKSEILFRELYFQVKNLSKMQTFTSSKKHYKQTSEFFTKHKAKFTGLNGSLKVHIPVMGTTSVNISYNNTHSELKSDNQKDLIFNVKLPILGKSVIGSKILKKRLKEFQNKTFKLEDKYVSDINEGITVLNKEFDNALRSLNYVISENADNLFNTSVAKSFVELSFYFTKTGHNDNQAIPLPGQDLYKKTKDLWTLTKIKSIKTKYSSLNIDKNPVSVNLSNSKSKSKSLIGPNSLDFPVNKFNAFTLSLIDRAENNENTLWIDLKKGQKSQLKKIFKNITKTSNSRYELQCMYNSIISNIKDGCNINVETERLISDTNKIFEDFLISCQKFKSDSSESNFNETSSLLDKILELNFKYNYSYDYNRVHSLNKK